MLLRIIVSRPAEGQLVAPYIIGGMRSIEEILCCFIFDLAILRMVTFRIVVGLRTTFPLTLRDTFSLLTCGQLAFG